MGVRAYTEVVWLVEVDIYVGKLRQCTSNGWAVGVNHGGLIQTS